MKRLWLILFVITGCAIHTTDYFGNEVNLSDEVMSLKEILQDPTDESIMYLTFEIAYNIDATLISRRLHDINRSGWWCLMCVTPLVVILIIFLCKKSDENENQFGAKPSNMFVTIDG